tara:strand:+ start:737 stop:868 length:132 start_codon:yes stop_codon:yes gene_type:complete
MDIWIIKTGEKMIRVVNFLDHLGVIVPMVNMIVFIYVVGWIVS